MRKDVECFFAILKNRTRFSTLQTKEDVDYAFKTACIIHNLILRHDGLHELWEDGVNWATVDPNGDGDEDEVIDVEHDADIYVTTVHNAATFIQLYINATIEDIDRRTYNTEGMLFERMRHYISRNLHLRTGAGA